MRKNIVLFVCIIIALTTLNNPLKGNYSNESFNNKSLPSPPPYCNFSSITITGINNPVNGNAPSTNMTLNFLFHSQLSTNQTGFVVKISIDNGQTWSYFTYTKSLNIADTMNFHGFNMNSPGLYKIIAEINNCPLSRFETSVYLTTSALSGTYTIGNNDSADFNNLSQAVDILNLYGLSGPVTLNLLPKIYYGSYALDNIQGMSSQNTLTIQSAFGDTTAILKSTSTYTNVFTLQRVNHLTIRNLNFRNYYSYTSAFIRIDSLCSSINISSNNFFSNSTTAINNCAILFNDSYNCRDIFIDSNTITAEEYGIKSIRMMPPYLKNIKIRNNRMLNLKKYGIKLNFTDSLNISANEITSKKYGIKLTFSKGKVSINNNKISTIQSSLDIHKATLTTPNPVVFNNMFSGKFSSCIFIPSGIDFYFNSVYLPFNNTTPSPCISVGNYAAGTNIKNNNIINKQTGTTISVPQNYTSVISSMDYNNLYTNGSYLAYWGTNITNLSALKTASSKNTHSISTNCSFISNGDLHINNSSLNNAGTAISGITNDYDYQLRNSSAPDIGCDEFSYSVVDGNLNNLTSDSILSTGNLTFVDLKNTGSINITSATIHWKVGSYNLPTKNWTGILTPNSIAKINLGMIPNLIPPSKITAWLSNVNLNADSNQYNDTTTSWWPGGGVSGTFTIGSSSTADFNSINDAILFIKAKGICGNVTLNLLPGTHQLDICIEQITGTNPNRRITIKPANKDSLPIFTIPYPNIPTFQINSASYITVKNLDFLDVILNITNSHHLIIDSCTFNLNRLIDFDNFLITNNSNNVIVRHCTFGKALRAVLFLSSSYLEFYNNKINNFNHRGIDVRYSNHITIHNNSIYNNQTYSAQSGEQTSGICMYWSDNMIVDKNRILIRSFSINNGINVKGNNYSINDCRITNNMISDFGDNCAGISLEFSNNSVVIHNTVYTSNNCLMENGSTGTIIMNNIFNSLRDIVSNNTNGDYNLLYTQGSILIRPNNYVSYANLVAVQSLGVQLHSMSFNPAFASSIDLIPNNNLLSGTGTYMSLYDTDINGFQRSSTINSMGAMILRNDIYDLSLESISLPKSDCTTGDNALKITVKNNNLGAINSFKVYYKLDTNTIDSILFNQSITTSQTKQLFVDSLNLSAGIHNLSVWVQPYVQNDANQTNNKINLRITAGPKPKLKINDTIYLTSTNCANSLNAIIPVYNTGNLPLSIKADNSVYSSQNNSGPIKILFVRVYHSYSNKETYILQTISQKIPGAIVTSSNHPDSATFNNLSLSNDVIIFSPDITTYEYLYYNMEQYKYSIKKFVASGGTAIFLAGNFKTKWIFDNDLWKGRIVSAYKTGSISYNNSNSIFNGINTPLTTNLISLFMEFDEPVDRLLYQDNFDMIVKKPFGIGQMFLLGMSYFNTTHTNNRTILANTILTAKKHNSLMQIPANAGSGTINPNDSMLIPVHFNLQGLSTGIYHTNLIITSNSYPSSFNIIPIYLNVTGNSVLSIDKDSIDFGTKPINFQFKDSVKISNNGCTPLYISISNNNNLLSYSISSYVIPVYSYRYIVFSYQPQQADTLDFNIILHTSDYDTTIHFSGILLGAPVLTTGYMLHTDTIEYCNDTLLIPFKIKNTGASPLTYSISNKPDKLHILAYNHTSNPPSDFFQTKSTIRSMPNVILDTITSTNTNTLRTAINNHDIFLLPPSITVNTFNASFYTMLKNYMKQGGVVIICNQTQGPLFNQNQLLDATTIMHHPYSTFVADYSSPIVQGVPNISNLDYHGYQKMWNFSDHHSIINSIFGTDTSAMVFTRDYYAGHYIYMGFYLHNQNLNTQKILIKNIINYAGSKINKNTTFANRYGIVAPSDSTTALIMVNTADMYKGLYTKKFYLSTNANPNSQTTFHYQYLVQNHLDSTYSIGSDTSLCSSNYILTAPGGYSYIWNTGSTNDSITITNSGGYTCSITTEKDCSIKDSVNITLFPIPSISFIGIKASYCQGTPSDTIQVHPNGGILIMNSVQGDSIIYPDSLTPGLYSINYSYTSSNGCSSSKTTYFQILPNPPISILNLDTTYCYFDTISNINFSPSGGTVINNSFINNVFYPAIDGAGPDTIIYQITNNYGCLSIDTGFTNIYPRTQTTSNISGFYCNNDSPILLNSSMQGGHFSGNNIMNDSLCPGLSFGNQLIFYHSFDSNSCLIADTFTTFINHVPDIIIGPYPNIVCHYSDSIVLSCNYQNAVFSGKGIWNNTIFPDSIKGYSTFYAQYTDTNNCITIDSAVIYSDWPDVNLGPDTSIAGGDSIVLSPGNSFLNYIWSTGNNTSSISVDSSGIGFGTKKISIIAFDTLYCAGKDTILITFSNSIGIQNRFPSHSIKIFPNPTVDKLNIKPETNDIKLKMYIIFNSEGSDVKSGRFNQKDAGNIYQIDVSHLASGTYYIALYIENQNTIGFKFIINK